MIDAPIRRYIDPPLNRLAYVLPTTVRANHVTVAAFMIGVMALPLLALGEYNWAILVIALNLLGDGLDGALARRDGPTDLGGYLDIVLDFIFYSAVVFGMCLAQPENAVFGALVIFSFIGTGSAFLAFSIFAEKRQLRTEARGIKSIYYLGGLTEGFETIVFLLLLCLLPGAFAVLCTIFATLCWITAASRIYTASQLL